MLMQFSFFTLGCDISKVVDGARVKVSVFDISKHRMISMRNLIEHCVAGNWKSAFVEPLLHLTNVAENTSVNQENQLRGWR